MKRFVFFSLVLGLTLACGKPETQVRQFQREQAEQDGPALTVTTTRTKGAPAWIDNADREGKLTAVGIAPPNPLNDPMVQRNQAVARGLAALAQKIQVDVDQLHSELVALNSQSNNPKKINREALDELKDVTRTLVNIRVRGAKIPYYWTDSQNGYLYVLVQLNDGASYDILNEAASRQPALKEALKELDTEIAKKLPQRAE